MRTILIGLLVAACGGSSKPTTPPPQLPEDKKPEPVAEAPKPAPPPKDPDPIDVPMVFGKSTYKLASAGKGQKSVIKIAATSGAKQQVELAVDFSGKQTADAALGGNVEDIAPTLVLNSDVEVAEAAADQAKFKVTFTAVDARARTGAKTDPNEFKSQLGVLQGIQMSGAVSPTGQISDASLHVAKPTEKTLAALELVKISLFPMWPIVPAEPVGVGAKWTVTTPSSVAGQIDATQVTEYEVVSHKGNAWVLKGKTKVDGKDQTIKQNKFEKIGGSGGAEITLTDDAFVPKSATKLANDFTATVGDGDKKQSVSFHLEQGLAIGPQGATPAPTPAPAGTPAGGSTPMTKDPKPATSNPASTTNAPAPQPMSPSAPKK